jgi:subtilase family serine protease
LMRNNRIIRRCGHKGLEDGMPFETLRRHNVSGATRSSFLAAWVLLLIASMIPLAHAQSTNLVLAPVDPGNRSALKGHHPAWASAQNDAGAVPADLALERLTIVLNRPPQVEAAFKQFIADQQNPQSPNYHHWLTPVEIGKRFGVSAHDLDAVTGWLQTQGLTVDDISNSRVRVTFSGPAANVANAFGGQLHYFQVGEEKRISLTGAPQIPVALSGLVRAISGLSTVKTQPQHRVKTAKVPVKESSLRSLPELTLSDGSHAIAPADFATIYNLNSGFNGTGQTIAIIGRSGVCAADITNFATLSGVTINGPTVIVPPLGVTPPTPLCTGNASGDQGEATLDVTRSGSIAQGAHIDLVISADTQTVDGILTSASYAVDTNPVPAHVMSISFGLCEAAAPSEATTYDNLFQQAVAEGISVMVSSGDSGVAGCDPAFNPPPAGASLAAPNLICSSGFGTCVGGTEFNDTANPGQYWNTGNTTTLGSALSYIPEGAWNEPFDRSNALQVAGTGGGVSLVIAQPTWQKGPGVPSPGTGRYTPDLSFSASGHDAYFACLAAGGGSCVVSGGSFGFVEFSGTSASAPDMAGVAAILNQSRGGTAQGHLNPTLYKLGEEQVTLNVFNDVTVATSGVTNCDVNTASTCNNTVASSTGLSGGTVGFLVNPGYDEATGLGSINIGNLLSAWASPLVPSLTAIMSSGTPVPAATNVTFTATLTPFSGTGATPTGNVTFMDGTTTLGTGPITSGTAMFSTTTLPVGLHSISAVYQGDATYAGSQASLSQTVGTLSQTAVQTSAPQIAVNTRVTLTATVAPQGGGTGTPTGTVAFFATGVQIGTGTLTSGTATINWTPTTAGSFTITGVYQGDTTFVGSTSSGFSQSVVDITVVPSSPSVSVVAGGNQIVSINVTPSAGYSPTVNVTCTGAPSESTCTVGTPTTSGGVQTFPINITTSAPHSLRQVTPMGMFIPLGLLLPLGGMFLAATGKRTRRNLGWLGLTLVLTMSTLWLSACGGSSKKDPGTPPGTYTLTVTATTSGLITINKTTNVSLVVTAQ